MKGYFIAPDAFGDLAVWREGGDFPRAVLAQHTLRDDPELWDAIAEAVCA